eukprot:1177219-Prorocentrum_minimum.AAC.6
MAGWEAPQAALDKATLPLENSLESSKISEIRSFPKFPKFHPVFGGRDSAGRCGDTFALDLPSLNWADPPPPPASPNPAPAPRSFAALCPLDGGVGGVSFGGVSKEGGALQESLEVLDISTMQWSPIEGKPSDRRSTGLEGLRSR